MTLWGCLAIAQDSAAAIFKSQDSNLASLAPETAPIHHDAVRWRIAIWARMGVWLWLWFPYLNSPEQHKAGGQLIDVIDSVKDE